MFSLTRIASIASKLNSVKHVGLVRAGIQSISMTKPSFRSFNSSKVLFRDTRNKLPIVLKDISGNKSQIIYIKPNTCGFGDQMLQISCQLAFFAGGTCLIHFYLKTGQLHYALVGGMCLWCATLR